MADDFWSTLGVKENPQAGPRVTPPPSTSPAPSGGDNFWTTLGNKSPVVQQSVSAGDNSPVQQSLKGPISEDNIPGADVQAAGSMATDPYQRRRIVAAQLFPTLDPQAAQSRVFFGPNGRMAAVGTDGHAFYVDPSSAYSPDVFRPSTWLPDNPLARAGSMVGPALAAGGAIVGGLAAAPESLLLGPVAAGGGAAIGDFARQKIAAGLDPGVPPTSPGERPTTEPYNYMQTGSEALGAGGGQAVAGSMLRLRPGYKPLTTNPLDVKALRDPAVQQSAADNYALARSQGVTITPGQASGLPSLLNIEDVFAQGVRGGEGANVAKAYYEDQRRQLIGAFDKTMDRVSPAADKTDAALQFQQGAEDAVRIVRQMGNAASRPYYQAAEGGGQVMSPDLAQLADIPAVKTAMDAARKEYPNLPATRGQKAPDTPDFHLWDATKRKLDDAHTIAQRAGENTTAGAIDGLRKDLLTQLDAAYPSYAKARETNAPFQRETERLKASVGRSIGEGTESESAILRPVFENTNPRAVMANKESFIKAGREDEWKAGVRAHVQDLFDKTVQSKEGLNPDFLRRQIWGNEKRREILRAAMDPAEFQGLENFMKTVEIVSRAKGVNSATAGRLAAANELDAQAADLASVKAIGAVKTAFSPMRAMDVLGKTGDLIQSWLIGRNREKIGQRLFSPEGQKFLQAMGKKPVGPEAVAAITRFLGQQGGARLAAPEQPPDEINALKMAP